MKHMTIRRNVSFPKDSKFPNKIKPFLDMHEGNFSAAIREIIDFADFARNKMGSLERAKELLTMQHNLAGLKKGDRLILSVDGVIHEEQIVA